MLIQHIHAENYKTYLRLDLDLSVEDDRPIVLIGGMNGGGKTTLFDAIYGALYGLDIRNERHFRELFNSGVKEIEGKTIVLEITFTGMVVNSIVPYRLKRTYALMKGKPVENVTMKFGSNTFSYGTYTPSRERAAAETAVLRIINANLPSELSNYFLFDAMKTSELVKDERINTLIQENIRQVMGFNKYIQLEKICRSLLETAKANRLENDQKREEYNQLQMEKNRQEEELQALRRNYASALEYATAHKEQVEALKAGKDRDEVTRDQMTKVTQQIQRIVQAEEAYKQQADVVAKSMETDIILPRLASLLQDEMELIENHKASLEEQKKELLTETQIAKVVDQVIEVLTRRGLIVQKVNRDTLVNVVRLGQQEVLHMDDPYDFLDYTDMETLRILKNSSAANPFLLLDQQRDRLQQEVEDLPKLTEKLENLQMGLDGQDYTLIKLYEEKERNTLELKNAIREKEQQIAAVNRKMETYDYDMPQVPDPKYDLLSKLPVFFNDVHRRLLKSKKRRVEDLMKEGLNLNLVSYAGTIGRVELSGEEEAGISFKIYHKSGNEIPLNQLNAGAKQTVMQVLLKVLYELSDYEPPVMIDTVMGVLDKESRATIIEHYFPDLARQTILLSTDSEIRTEDDWERLEGFVSKAYTLHRDKERQCTTVSEGYFGKSIIE
ncbi:MAG: AAA family ATPase [Phocaeicola plebeius]